MIKALKILFASLSLPLEDFHFFGSSEKVSWNFNALLVSKIMDKK